MVHRQSGKDLIKIHRARKLLEMESRVAVEVLVLRFAATVYQGSLKIVPSRLVVVSRRRQDAGAEILL